MITQGRVALMLGVFALASLIACLISFALMAAREADNEKFDAWEAPYAWRAESCEVLAVGVACAEVDTKSTCGGLGGTGPSVPAQGPVVFKAMDIAVCPGAYWCSKEGESCTCHGEVAYASELYTGTEYRAPSARYRQKVSGTITCGQDAQGRALEDPAPYHVKHCWCTPQRIVEALEAPGVRALSPGPCATLGNSEFTGPDSSEQGLVPTSNRRLLADGKSPWNASEEPDLPEEDSGEEDSTDRRLLSIHGGKTNMRRRRTFAYTPWALVKVPGADEKSGGDIVTCAYAFGAPVITKSDYTTSGPGGSQKWGAQTLAISWTSLKTCQVRQVGPPGSDMCAVAMETGGGRSAQLESSMFAFTVLLWVLGCGGMCCLLGAIGLFCFDGPRYHSLT